MGKVALGFLTAASLFISYEFNRGTTGLKETEGNVFPVFGINLMDDEGNTLLSNPNLFSEYVSSGMDAADVKKQFSATELEIK